MTIKICLVCGEPFNAKGSAKTCCREHGKLVMPSGKTLRESTKEELTALGGWAVAVAIMLQPGQTVGQAHLTAEQLEKVYPQTAAKSRRARA